VFNDFPRKSREVLDVCYSITENEKFNIIPGMILNETKILNEPVFDETKYENNCFYTVVLVNYDQSATAHLPNLSRTRQIPRSPSNSRKRNFRDSIESLTTPCYPVYWMLANMNSEGQSSIIEYKAPKSTENLRRYFFFLFKQEKESEEFISRNVPSDPEKRTFIELDFVNLVAANFFYLRNEQKQTELIEKLRFSEPHDILLRQRKEIENRFKENEGASSSTELDLQRHRKRTRSNLDTSNNPRFVFLKNTLSTFRNKVGKFFAEEHPKRFSDSEVSINNTQLVKKTGSGLSNRKSSLCSIGNKINRWFSPHLQPADSDIQLRYEASPERIQITTIPEEKEKIDVDAITPVIDEPTNLEKSNTENKRYSYIDHRILI
jgi:hypothetical protein